MARYDAGMDSRAQRTVRGAALAIALASGAGHLFAESAGEPLWALLLKPLPVLVLFALVCVAESSALKWAVAAGLASSAVGDLLIQRPGGFFAGLLAFLLAHLAYSTGFWRAAPELQAVRAIPCALFGGGMAFWVTAGAGEFRVPVTIYIVAISLMIWRAAALGGAPGLASGVGQAALCGAIFFAASDSLIAIHRFVVPLSWASVPIMVLYWLGQSGIAVAAVRAGGPGSNSTARRAA